jgi:hypothetical protein
MAGGLLFRLFGAGRMPADVRRQIAAEHVLFEAQGIKVVLHRHGRVPGSVVAGTAVNAGLGSFAVTDRRVIGTRGRGKWVDVPYDAAAPGPATLTLDGVGLHVVFDLDRVHPSCQGEMRIDFHEAIPDADLARFPNRNLTFDVDPQKVVRLFGSLKKLPA